MDEFALIDLIVAELGDCVRGEGVVLGPGDDCALVEVPAGHQLVITTDTLVERRHFPKGAPPEDVGYRSIAVNLSDLASMGAQARYCVVSTTCPTDDPGWMKRFAGGIRSCLERYGVAIVGGNLSRGPLSITVTAHGIVPAGEALLRSGASPGDRIFVTGEIGSAASQSDARYYRPEPRLAAGAALRGVATAAIDVSDGLAADLGHVCERSGVGAVLELDRVPLAPGRSAERAVVCGDDYEILFTVPEGRDLPDLGVDVTQVGRIVDGTGVRALQGGREVAIGSGYRHF